MLTARSLEKTYQVGTRTVSALKPVDIEVPSGSFVTILGRSGSGKSTLLALLGGLASPTAGEVVLGGQKMSTFSAAARRDQIGYMFQFAGLLPTLTALENAVLPAKLAGKDVRDRAVEWLTELGLGERLWALPSELSGGEQRRVAAVRAVIHQPSLVLADEPTGDLDPTSERQVIDFLRRHTNTLILVTHNAELGQGADQLLRMERGSLQTLEAQPEVHRVPVAPDPVEAAGIEERPSSRLGGRLVVFFTLLLALFLVGDLVTTHQQRKAVQATRQARKTLERAAMFHLRADVGNLKPASNGSYKVELFVDNPFTAEPIYLMPPEVSAYVQVGFNWTEVSLKPMAANGVIKLVGRQTFEYVLKPDVASFQEVLPGYMHVRFSDTMQISLKSQPEPGEVVQRKDNYFVYLQPEGADALDLGRRNNFPGKAPLWIPMPPH